MGNQICRLNSFLFGKLAYPDIPEPDGMAVFLKAQGQLVCAFDVGMEPFLRAVRSTRPCDLRLSGAKPCHQPNHDHSTRHSPLFHVAASPISVNNDGYTTNLMATRSPFDDDVGHRVPGIVDS